VAGKYLIHIIEVRFSNICLQTDRLSERGLLLFRVHYVGESHGRNLKGANCI